jgi:glycosyltransferase involved in cell wall biosynthesis
MLGRIRGKFGRIITRWQGRFPLIKFFSFIPVHYKRLSAYQPDIIYAHDLSTLPLSALVAKETGAKLVFDSHELEVHRNPPLGLLQRLQVKWVEKRYLPRCDFVTTVCESAENVLRYEYKLKNTGLIYNAPRLRGGRSHERWERHKGLSFRGDAGLARDDFALVYVGLITRNRGIEFALNAIERLPEKIKLVAVGPGLPAIKARLRAYADRLGLGERFIMLDPVNPPDVYKYIKGADAAIIPIMPVTLSYEIALPNKFFEAGFAGLPIISADLVEMKKLISEYNLGVTYDALDEEACAAAILHAYKNRFTIKPSKESVAALRDRFSWETQEAFIISILDEQTALKDQYNESA